MANTPNDSNKDAKQPETVKVQSSDAGQSAIEQLLNQENQSGQSGSLNENVGHEHFDNPPQESVNASNINPIYMQPNTEGKFAFVKKEFDSSIKDDKELERRNQESYSVSLQIFFLLVM